MTSGYMSMRTILIDNAAVFTWELLRLGRRSFSDADKLIYFGRDLRQL